ncbi:MAG: hypothetical protein QF682_02865 [Candidatus Thermoplasmatota archaeon]|nr:hypothetical protein [Candidatus Thermoplasmatota archaeon]
MIQKNDSRRSFDLKHGSTLYLASLQSQQCLVCLFKRKYLNVCGDGYLRGKLQ